MFTEKEFSRLNTFYYLVVSIIFGSQLAVVILYLSYSLFGTPMEYSFFILLAASSTGTIFAAISMSRYAGLAERSKARQSHRILEITRQTLPHLRKGLNYESAAEVVRIVHEHTDAVAVSITDRTTILGFYGVGDDHHRAENPILTRATKDAIEHSTTRILSSKAEIGCPEPKCQLQAAIVVLLSKMGKTVGTLKFYYSDPAKITESKIAVAEGLAHLLSTQIELSELDRQRELAYRAELRALQSQINPHFLFNTLNTITAFIRTDPKEARKLLIQFANFFRKTLEWEEGGITLAQELDYVSTYLALEKARFGDRLCVVFDIDEDAGGCTLPGLLIQPIVENAVKHGLTEGHELDLVISAKLYKDNLQISVVDDGPGIPPDELERVLKFGYGKGTGIGLSNVNERLKSLYGEDRQIKIQSQVGRGTTIKFTIPVSRSVVA